MKYGLLFTGAFCLLMMTACAGKEIGEPQPTAIIVDAETGEPVEGAVAMAIWYGVYDRDSCLWGGGVTEAAEKRVDVVSDKLGRIYIDGFWDGLWYKSPRDLPRLSVYKCRYVCWLQYRMLSEKSNNNRRYAFSRENNIVRMEKWPEYLSYNRHHDFIHAGDEFDFVSHEGPFFDAFHRCELQGSIDEDKQRLERRKQQ